LHLPDAFYHITLQGDHRHDALIARFFGPDKSSVRNGINVQLSWSAILPITRTGAVAQIFLFQTVVVMFGFEDSAQPAALLAVWPIKESQGSFGEWNRGIINGDVVAARNNP
jgi:hypothetical protein